MAPLRSDSNAILLPSGEMLADSWSAEETISCALALEILEDQAARYWYWSSFADRQGDGRTN
jgi:hypothetical protein